MSTHLDPQTGPNVTIGNRGSPFYQSENESRVEEQRRSALYRATFPPLCLHHNLLYNVGGPRFCRFVVLVKPNPA